MTNQTSRDLNRDPITGTPGSHPVGVGVGGVAGAAAGAVVGAVFGPLGMLVGGTVGAVAGAAAGKGAAERLDPTGEDAYWREEHRTRPYYDQRYDYDTDYGPAYAYGSGIRAQYGDRTWDDNVENEVRMGWEGAKNQSRLGWGEARDVVKDAYDRADRSYRTYAATDDYYASRYHQAAYYDPHYDFEDYRPAYRYGTYARSRDPDGEWRAQTEQDLERGWESAKGNSRLGWDKARDAVRDAWHGVERMLPGDADRDGR